jgi:hypothetical protein
VLEYAAGLIRTQVLGVYDMLLELLSSDMFHDQVDMVHCFHHLKSLMILGWYSVFSIDISFAL